MRLTLPKFKRPQPVKLSRELGRTSRIFTLLILFGVFVTQGTVGSAAPISTTPEDWEFAKKKKIQSTFQISFPNSMVDQEDDVIAQSFAVIPEQFREFKLNTLGRLLHGTLLYQDGITLSKVRKLTKILTNLPPGFLEKHKLLDEVTVIDETCLEFGKIGVTHPFLAWKPHREFREWVGRFWAAIGEVAPWALALHKSHKDLGEVGTNIENVHLSLIQGYTPDAPIEAAKTRMVNLFTNLFQRYREKHGRGYRLTFKWTDSTVDLVTAPISIQKPPVPIITFQPQLVHGRKTHSLVTNKIGSLYIGNEFTSGAVESHDIAVDAIGDSDTGAYIRKVEFDVATFLRNERNESPIVQNPDYDPSWFEFPTNSASLSHDDFVREAVLGAPEAARGWFGSALKAEQKSSSPADLPAPWFASESPLQPNSSDDPAIAWTRARTHPMLDPRKAAARLERIRHYLPQDQADIISGVALYASSGRKEILTPGDVDLLLNTIVHVPDSTQTIESAQEIAVDRFMNHTLGYYRALAKKEEIAIIEFRAGSRHQLMPVKPKSILAQLEALKDNPTLTQAEFLAGSHLYQGQHYTLRELVQLKNFIKAKIQLEPGTSSVDEASIQFILGFHWRGNNYVYNGDGMKGIQAILGTATYPTLKSYGVGYALNGATKIAALKRSDPLPRAIGEIQETVFHPRSLAQDNPFTSPALLSAKAAKKIYNTLIFLRNNGQLDEIFFTETLRILQAEDKDTWSHSEFNLKFLKFLSASLVSAANYGLTTTLAQLRRRINDLREFNERQQSFTEKQWRDEVFEIHSLLEQLYEPFDNPRSTKHPKGLDRRYLQRFNLATSSFTRIFNQNCFLPDGSLARYEIASRFFRSPERYQLLRDFEEEIYHMEAALSVRPKQVTAVAQYEVQFIETMVAYGPIFFYRYWKDRSLDTGPRFKLALAYMNIEPTPQNISRLDEISQNYLSWSRQEVATAMAAIYSDSERIKKQALQDAEQAAPTQRPKIVRVSNDSEDSGSPVDCARELELTVIQGGKK